MAVDPDGSGLDIFGRFERERQLLGVNRGGEAEDRVVRYTDGLLGGPERHGHKHGTEDFLSDDLRGGVDSSDQGWWVETTGFRARDL